MQKDAWWRRMFAPWRNPVPPTVPWSGPVTFRCEKCGEHHDGTCPEPGAARGDDAHGRGPGPRGDGRGL